VVKVEERLCDGRVLFHKYEQRSAQAVAEQQAEWEAKEDLRQQRRQQQVRRAGWRWAL
jgi:ribosome biogenesis protein SSF1/2